jgi:radical SAM protein with 4Fe4S-binding SPASM domain
MHAAAAKRRIPVTATVEVTRRCNCRCVHCYTNLSARNRGERDRELSLAEHHRLLDELGELGTLWLLYTGGEPFLRPDFLEVYTAAKRRGFIVTLFTNATLIDRAAADTLASLRPFLVEVTLYGGTEATYDHVTRAPGSFREAWNGVQRLVARSIPIRLKTVVLRENVHELSLMEDQARQMGLEFRFDASINSRVDGGHAPLSHRLEPAELVRLDARNERRMEEWGNFCEKTLGGIEAQSRSSSWRAPLYMCGAGATTLAVDPHGRILPCTMARMQSYDLRHGTVRDAWDRFLHTARQQLRSRESRCTHCQLTALCDMCPAYGWLENGDSEEPDDFICHVAHLRAALLGVEIPPHGRCPYCPGGESYETLQAELAELEEVRRHGSRLDR